MLDDAGTAKIASQCGRLRQALREQLANLGNGRMVTHDITTGQPVESTDDSKKKLQGWILELENILSILNKALDLP